MAWIAFLSNKQSHLMSSELLEAHIEYLRKIWPTGVLTLCGPLADDTAIMVFNVDSEQQAKLLVDGDPFSEVNYYQNVRYVEFMDANPGNNFLFEEALRIMSTSEYKSKIDMLKLSRI
ncbi:YciI family protein [Vibrio coralliilyticus]|uniref:YciI family protein n=1 Tax=Vibrio coralliilyticus TaxID=190893 RepID=UPI000C16E83C|nr:YciI family protein [Vibrio coralliilyticus]